MISRAFRRRYFPVVAVQLVIPACEPESSGKVHEISGYRIKSGMTAEEMLVSIKVEGVFSVHKITSNLRTDLI